VTPAAAVASVWSDATGTLSSVATVGAGIDLVDLASFAELHAAGGQAFIDNAWTTAEQLESQGSAERLAARWAAKEAVMKAMKCGIGDLDPLDIEILTDPNGAPRVQLRDSALGAAAALGVSQWHVSLCHEAGWAVAIAVAARSSI